MYIQSRRMQNRGPKQWSHQNDETIDRGGWLVHLHRNLPITSNKLIEGLVMKLCHENNGATVYVERAATLHNLCFNVHTTVKYLNRNVCQAS